MIFALHNAHAAIIGDIECLSLIWINGMLETRITFNEIIAFFLGREILPLIAWNRCSFAPCDGGDFERVGHCCLVAPLASVRILASAFSTHITIAKSKRKPSIWIWVFGQELILKQYKMIESEMNRIANWKMHLLLLVII